MGARDLIVRTLRTVARAVEGEYRPGPYSLPISGGWLPDGTDLNWWQQGENIRPLGTRLAMVEACVSAYSQTVAMCPGAHWRTNKKGGRERVDNSALSRIMKRPNTYESMSDFLLNAVRQLYLDGNAYALALRNDRFEISELHLMDSRLCFPRVAPQTGDVFYHLHGNSIIEYEFGGLPITVPQRDVLHIRLHADRNRRYPFPLWGQTPLYAALSEIGLADSILGQQTAFYNNQARPSAVLTTDLVMDKDQVQALRDRWDEQSKGINLGRTPILTAGLKVQPWSAPPRDAQIAELLKIAEERIALVFRVPLEVLGIGAKGVAAEALMQFWISTGLGFCLNHIEEAFGLLFALKGQPDEFAEFDTSALLRSAQKDRIEALARGVQGGIYSPNEAREQEGLPSVKFGEEPRTQQQVVPLSAAESITEPGATGPHPPPAPGPKAPPAAGTKPEEKPPEKPQPATAQKATDHDNVKREFRAITDAAARIRRRIG